MAQKRRQPEIIAGRVNSDGSIFSGDGFTVAKTGTGAYTITFLGGFRAIAATAIAGSSNQAVQGGASGSTFNVGTFLTSTGAGADMAFSFVAVGVQQ